jgi:hypothetical protein
MLSLCFQALSQEYIPGNSYMGISNFTEYIAGNLPIIIAAPHGGNLQPDSIPDRTCGTNVMDSYTKELSIEIAEAIKNGTGCYPHLIINNLHRRKIDTNRDLPEATCNLTTLDTVWNDFHRFIEVAKEKVSTDFQKGFFIDIHGHGHSNQRLELGYLLNETELGYTDEQLNSSSIVNKSSIKNLVQQNISESSHSDLLRGAHSFGSMIDSKSYPAVPSTNDPFPLLGELYFTGGYNTRRHGSLNGGTIDGIQIECNQDVRFQSNLRKAFADSLANVILEFMEKHYFNNFLENPCQETMNRIQKKLDNQLKIYPNPFYDELLIEFDSEIENSSLTITNLQGQIVFYDNLHGNLTKIDLNKIESGIYIAEIRIHKSKSLHKLVKLVTSY